MTSNDTLINKTCDICKNKFTTVYLLNKHKNKKISCVFERITLINNEISDIKKILKEKDKCLNLKDKKCFYCKNIYSTKGTLKGHLFDVCKLRKKIEIKLKKNNDELDELTIIKNKIDQTNDEINDEINDQNDENNEIKDEIKDKIKGEFNVDTLNKNMDNLDKKTLLEIIYKLATKDTSKQIIQTQNNANNQQIIENQNITNNIQINLTNFDNPNCDFLTLDQKNRFLKDRYKGLIDFITYVYFNESYPENHTILYTNLRSKFGQIYKNNKWFIEEIDMIANKLNEYSFEKLNEHLEEIKSDDKNAEKYKKEIDKGIQFVNHYVTNDTTKQTKTDIKKTLYNNKDIIMKTKDKTINQLTN
jgi:hypothetical protein